MEFTAQSGGGGGGGVCRLAEGQVKGLCSTLVGSCSSCMFSQCLTSLVPQARFLIFVSRGQSHVTLDTT